MNTHIDSAVRTEDDIAAFLSPDPDMQRGRKRQRRDDVGGAIGMGITGTRKQIPSGESATLRGRCRRRSTSRATLSGFSSRSRSRSCARDSRDGDGTYSPANSKKCIFRFVHLNGGPRRRSQSPSRSCSSNRQALASSHNRRRRRQRTRSRSRDHLKDRHAIPMGSVVDLKSPLCSEMMVSDGDEGRKGALED